ncbi:hypothetical protein [Ornithinimicrobium kibberense]
MCCPSTACQRRRLTGTVRDGTVTSQVATRSASATSVAAAQTIP